MKIQPIKQLLLQCYDKVDIFIDDIKIPIDGVTYSRVSELLGKDRIEEIARMLSGNSVTNEAREASLINDFISFCWKTNIKFKIQQILNKIEYHDKKYHGNTINYPLKIQPIPFQIMII